LKILKDRPEHRGAGIREAVPAGSAKPRSFFAQWLNSTGVPEFSLDYVVYRTPKVFASLGKSAGVMPVGSAHRYEEIRN